MKGYTTNEQKKGKKKEEIKRHRFHFNLQLTVIHVKGFTYPFN